SNTEIFCHGGMSTVTVNATRSEERRGGKEWRSQAAGTYSYTVTDSKSCTATTTGDITQPPTLVPDSSNTEIFCHGGMSTVTVSATGGTAPYSGTGTFSHAAGTYSYTVTDSKSCPATTTRGIRHPAT